MRHIMIIHSADGPTAIYTAKTKASKQDCLAIAAVSAAIAAVTTALLLCVKHLKKK